jgi:hypothetical protein
MNIALKKDIMKNTLSKIWHGLAGATVLLSAAGGPSAVQAATPVSPVGTTWDCVISGASQGVGFLTFSGDPSTGDATLGLVEIIVPKAQPPPSSSVAATRGLSGDETRTGTTTVSGGFVLPPFTNVTGLVILPQNDTTNFGNGGTIIIDHSGVPSGQWRFDSFGRVVGFFTEVSGNFCTTNVTPVFTGITDGITNFTFVTNIICQRDTNAISFIGKVVAGKRLTINCSTPAGRVIYQGVPSSTLADLGGTYNGSKKDHGLPYAEFFNLSSTSFDNTAYIWQGSGPGYVYGDLTGINNSLGAVLVSSHKAIAMAAKVYPGSGQNDSPPLRVVYGSVDFRRFKLTTKGVEQPVGAAENRISFTGQK